MSLLPACAVNGLSRLADAALLRIAVAAHACGDWAANMVRRLRARRRSNRGGECGDA